MNTFFSLYIYVEGNLQIIKKILIIIIIIKLRSKDTAEHDRAVHEKFKVYYRNWGFQDGETIEIRKGQK